MKKIFFQFDTRDKKPKVYNIAVISVIMAVLLVVLFRQETIRLAVLGTAILTYLILTIAFLVIAFIKQLQYNPYSYNTIYYSGFALFLLSVLISQIRVFAVFSFGNYTDSEGVLNMLFFLIRSAKDYMLLSFPFVLFFSVALCVSNISLIRHEGKRLVNILGIILSVCMIGGELIVYFGDYYMSGSMIEVMVRELMVNLFAAFYLYFECMLIGTIIASMIVVRYEPEKDKDYLIILGCGIRKDGSLTPLLAGRVDRALRFRDEQIKAAGKVPVLIPSGGQGADEPVSESKAMKNYLLEKGIPEKQILMESRSGSTYENMLFSKELIEKRKPNAKVAFFTTNYHVFRSGLLARRVKMRAVGAGAKTKWYFWPNAAVREFVGILTEHRLKQGLIFGGMAALYICLTIFVYMGL